MKIKIGNIKLTRERLIIAAVAIAIVGIVYFVIYKPATKESMAKRMECRSLESQVREEHSAIELAGKAAAERVLMTEKDSSLAIDELAKHGKLMGINFISMKPKEMVKAQDTQYRILPVEMEVEATDEQLLSFIGSLDEFKKSIITIESFDVSPKKDDKSKLKAGIVIDIYFSSKETQPGE